MARPTDEERQFERMGAGIAFSRWWPALALLLAILIASATPHLFDQCVGDALEGRGKIVGYLRIFLTYPCSPLLLRGSFLDWTLFGALWLPIPFAIVNWRWAKRHRAYWNRVRARERDKQKVEGENRD